MMVTKRSFHGVAIGRFRHKGGANEVQDGDEDQNDTESENKRMRLELEESSQVGPICILKQLQYNCTTMFFTGGPGKRIFRRHREAQGPKNGSRV